MSHTALLRSARFWLPRKTCRASARHGWSLRSNTTSTTTTLESNIPILNSKPSAHPHSAEQRATQYSSDGSSQPILSSSSASSPLLTTATIPNLSDDHPTNTTTTTSSSSSSSNPRQSPPISENIRQLLPLLKAQERYYITIHIHDKPYLVTPGDIVRLPFLMHGVVPGDVLRLNRASVLGSRDFTLKAGAPIIVGRGNRGSPISGIGGAGDDMATSSMTTTMMSSSSSSDATNNDGNIQATYKPETCRVDGQDVGLVPGAMRRMQYIDDRLFVCRAVVMGTESEPMRLIRKKKQRNRRVRTVKSKHRYTILKIKELVVKDVDEVV